MDKVIFRKFNDGDVIALLPDEKVNWGNIGSYMHIGQHSEADSLITYTTKPASPDEYADLLGELIQIGYEPKIYKRLQYGWLNWQNS